MNQPRLQSDHDAAAALIVRQNAAGRKIDKMQLEKLLYLVFGAHFALWNERAFREAAFAWRRGPVFPNVERTYRDGPQILTHPLGGDPSRLSPELSDTVDLVLSLFGSWPAKQLEYYVKHGDSPWSEVYGKGSTPENNEIPDEVVARWFRSHGVAPNRPRMSEQDFANFMAASEGNEEALAKLLA